MMRWWVRNQERRRRDRRRGLRRLRAGCRPDPPGARRAAGL